MKPMLSGRGMRLMALALALVCLAALYRDSLWCGAIARGQINVTLLYADRSSLDTTLLPTAERALHILLAEKVRIEPKDGALPSPACRVGVIAMGLLRFFPSLLALISLCIACLRYLWAGGVDMATARLLFWAGLIYLLSAVLIPPLNRLAIPALVEALSGDVLHIGQDVTRGPIPAGGLALMFVAGLCKEIAVKREAQGI